MNKKFLNRKILSVATLTIIYFLGLARARRTLHFFALGLLAWQTRRWTSDTALSVDRVVHTIAWALVVRWEVVVCTCLKIQRIEVNIQRHVKRSKAMLYSQVVTVMSNKLTT